MDGLDKLTARIGGRPVLDWTVSAFVRHPAIARVVVVVAADRVQATSRSSWLPAGARVVAGGERRQESVAAGVAEVERGGAADDGILLVHDGARPNVDPDLISRVIDATAAHGAAIPVVPAVETVKQLSGDVVAATVDRTDLGFAQTPQGFRLGILRAAWDRFPPDGPPTFTDEAALLEACTIPVHVVPGHPDNLKVTLPADLRRAAMVLGAAGPRVGLGEDSHPIGPGEPLALGGLAIGGAPRLSGHSDGDVVLHAVADALLGAAGLGDLGRLFPSDERTPRGIPSTALLAEVLARVRAAGLAPTGVDLTIVGARPRLGSRLDDMRAGLADLLGVPPGRVNVKASTGNLAGDEGAGRVVSARAIATLEAVP